MTTVTTIRVSVETHERLAAYKDRLERERGLAGRISFDGLIQEMLVRSIEAENPELRAGRERVEAARSEYEEMLANAWKGDPS